MRNIYLSSFFVISVILISCNKNDKDLPAPTHTYYMDTKVDGKSVAYEDSLRGVLNTATVSVTDFGTYHLTKSASTFSGTDVFGDSINTVIAQYKKGCSCDTAFIDSMFTARSYDFVNNGQQEGIEISWYDGTMMWSTSSGSADQSGSYFKIVKHEFVGKSAYRYISSGNLNCKLYNANGDVKIMTGYFKIKTNKVP